MGSGKAFDFPKPSDLIMHFIHMITDSTDIILDSFAGSTNTAHMDYADTITAERMKRVISGYGEGKSTIEGTGDMSWARS